MAAAAGLPPDASFLGRAIRDRAEGGRIVRFHARDARVDAFLVSGGTGSWLDSGTSTSRAAVATAASGDVGRRVRPWNA